MIEENGHNWESGHPDARCWGCGMRYSYYLDIKRAAEEQPEREDLKGWLKCK